MNVISPEPPTTIQFLSKMLRRVGRKILFFLSVMSYPYIALYRNLWPRAIDTSVKPFGREKNITMKNHKVGVLLVHGFAAAPDIFETHIPWLIGLGYDVHTVRISGHATSPRDFAKKTCVDWYLSVRDKYLDMSKQYEEVILFGHSLGALLSLLIASVYPVNTIIMISPPVKLREKPLYKVSFLLRPISILVKFWPTDKDMLEQTLRYNYQMYRKHPLQAVANLIDIIEFTRSRIHLVKSNVYATIGDQDEYATTDVLDIIKNSCNGNVKTKVIPGAPHTVLINERFNYVKNDIEQFLLSNSPPRSEI